LRNFFIQLNKISYKNTFKLHAAAARAAVHLTLVVQHAAFIS